MIKIGNFNDDFFFFFLLALESINICIASENIDTILIKSVYNFFSHLGFCVKYKRYDIKYITYSWFVFGVILKLKTGDIKYFRKSGKKYDDFLL